MAENNTLLFFFIGAIERSGGKKVNKVNHSPDNSPIKQGEYEIKYNGSPSNKMVYPCPEVSF